MPKRMSRREHMALGLMAACITVFMGLQFVVFPMIEKKNRLARAVIVKTRDLKEMVDLRQEYVSLNQMAQRTRKRLADRSEGFTLFSFLDGLAGTAGIKDRIAYMRPSTVSRKDEPFKMAQVEMKIQSASLEKIVFFLTGVELSENAIAISRLSLLKPDKEKPEVDTILQVETPEM